MLLSFAFMRPCDRAHMPATCLAACLLVQYV
nr:MAG TPA: hypothetical protein [Caudoviricetes sp.]